MDNTEKRPVDWIAVEKHYSAGIRSLQNIGREYGISKGRISQVAKQKGWVRDLKKRIAAKADAKLNERVLNDALNEPRRRTTEEQVIEATADLQYRAKVKARQDIVELEEVVFMLMHELRAQTTKPDVFDVLGEIMRADDNRGQDKRNEIYQRVISFSSRVDSAKKLVEMVERLVLLKFKLFGIKDEDEGVADLDQLLLKIHRERMSRGSGTGLAPARTRPK